MSYMDYEKLAVFGHPSRCINATKLSLHLRDKNSIFPVSIEFIVDSRTAKMESKMYMLIAVVAVILEPSFSQGCGQRMASRVVNGNNAKRHAWPWQISLRVGGRHICGGSIIHPRWVLTAAHCVEDNPSTRGYTVIVGAHALSERPKKEQVFYLQKVIMHERYGDFNFDVALLQLKKAIKMSSKARAVCLPKHGTRISAGKRCYITGWGVTETGKDANILQQAVLPVANDKRCRVVNGRLGEIRPDTMICAGGQGKGKPGGCEGDSGGPLVCNEGGKFVLRGAVSWGQRNCNTNYFTVFARISSFVEWIKQKMRKYGR